MNESEYRNLLKSKGFHRSGLDREMFLGMVYGDYESYSHVDKICRYCRKEVTRETAAITGSYWGGFTFLCHASCRIEGERCEAYACQLIDADCNDCSHFTSERVSSGGEVRYGHCGKFDKPVVARPNFCSSLDCFEHRRSEPLKKTLDRLPVGV